MRASSVQRFSSKLRVAAGSEDEVFDERTRVWGWGLYTLLILIESLEMLQ
jgi:hypothetical protein